jgi:hypothetical protein
MASDGSRVWVWCEDRRTEQFARELLTKKLRLQPRAVRWNVAPKGSGSAAQWVIQNCPRVESMARASKHQSHLGFLVIVDGDQHGLVGRMHQVVGEPDRREHADRIAVWVPTWSIETWVLWLCDRRIDGEPVDDRRSLKHDVKDNDYRSLVSAAVAAWEPPRGTETSAMPSLSRARAEVRRLPLD